MQSTRWQILTLLKQHPPGYTVENLAQLLGLAPMTVRQHLSVLLREGYVTYREERRPLGRPHYLYQATPATRNLFPQNYPQLFKRLLYEIEHLEAEEIAGLSPREKVGLLFRKAAERAGAATAEQLAALPLEERVATATELLTREGALADWQATPSGYEIRVFHCPYQDVAALYPELCQCHLLSLQRILGVPVVMTQHLLDENSSMDAFLVQSAPPASPSSQHEAL